jgi:hypothetical protein
MTVSKALDQGSQAPDPWRRMANPEWGMGGGQARPGRRAERAGTRAP